MDKNYYLDSLIKSAKSINDILQKLEDLEINNKKNSEEFEKNLGYLEMLLEYENEIYSQVPDEVQDEIYELLCNKKTLSDLKDEKKRIKHKLALLSLYRNESHQESILMLMAKKKYNNDEINHYLATTDIENVLIHNDLLYQTFKNYVWKNLFNKINQYNSSNTINFKYQLFNTAQELDEYFIKNKFEEMDIENYHFLSLITDLSFELLDKLLSIYISKVIIEIMSFLNDTNKNHEIYTLLLHTLIDICPNKTIDFTVLKNEYPLSLKKHK